MANVSFLKGIQSDFDGLSSYTAGAFYLTTDTNRLYFANSSTKANYLNKYVYTVSTKTELESAITNKEVTKGDFVYVSNLNALVAITGASANNYVQINAYTNTNDDTVVSNLTYDKAVGTNDVTITTTLKQTKTDVNGKQTVLDDIVQSFTISADDIGAIVTPTAVDVNATISNGTATVKTSGHGATGDGFTITGDGSVQILGSADKITVKGTNTTYDLTSPANETSLHLVGSDGSNDEITFSAGKQIAITGSTASDINIAHDTVGTTPATHSTTLSNNGKFTAINAVTTDNGHITGYTTETYTLPKAPKYSITDVSADGGTISVTLADSTSGSSETVSSTEDLYYYVNGNKVYNQATLDVYTKAQIDEKVNGINAMVYKGTVGGTGATVTSLPSTGVKIGDTYKVAAKGTYGTHACDVGDLLIAVGTETDGVITSGLAWTYVPSGDDTDSQFALSNDGNTIKLTNSTSGGAAGSVSLAAGNDLVISNSGSTITFKHEDFSTASNAQATASETNTATLSHGGTFLALTGVLTDNGHLTGYKATTFTLPTDNNTTYTWGTASNKITLTGTNGYSNSTTFAASNKINVSTSGSTITFKHDTITTPSTASSNTNDTNVTATNGGSIVAITGLTGDGYGHVTGYTTKTYNIPAYLSYTIAGASADVTGGVKFTSTLTGSNGKSSTSDLTVKSTSLALSQASGVVTVDLEWGTFG